MVKVLFLVLIVVGVMLLIYGIRASDSLGSDISRFFTNSPTDKAIWMLIAGVALGLIGLMGLLRGSRATP